MLECVDQLGHKLFFKAPPKRIVSLVPSLSELLFDFGLKESIVGVTKYCKYPIAEIANVEKIGGTKDPDISKILSLMPDLIIANKEENQKEHVLELQKHIPVYVSDINNLEDVYAMISALGAIFNKEDRASCLVNTIINNFSSLLPFSKPGIKVLYMIWRKPYMTVGGDTFISHMLSLCGWENLYKEHNRYPQISKDFSEYLSPDIVFLSSEPYPFKEKHLEEFRQLYPLASVRLVDGEYFSWYGSRLISAPEYFKNLQKNIESLKI
jgi:ABC-type Fe3+-hydroxamate transport system substrate-binding protein